MYVMKVDGKVFYAPTMPQMEYQVLTPNLKQELNTSGELTFVLPPGHVMRDSIHKMKSVLTVEQNGVEIFRGRVSEETVDTSNQKECYCEGDLSYLVDSMQRPYTYDGSAKDYFRQVIAKHNEQVEEGKRFTVGLLTALTDDNKVVTESVDYKDTLAEIKFILVNEFGGYLRTRYENGVRYIDYIKEYDDVCTQKIELGVNLLDLDDQIIAKDLCTVLIPLGKRDKNNAALTIASVNNGSDCIESAEGIAKYGRICKIYAWDDVEDPAELLKKGQEKLNELAVSETLTLKAIDLHLLNVDVDKIRVGSKVRLVSKPHGLDKEEICTAIDIDLENPENTVYTFGEPAETMTGYSSGLANRTEEGLRNQWKHIKETKDSVTIQADQIALLGKEISLKAEATVVEDAVLRLNTVEIDLNAAEAELKLKASQTTVDELGNRVSSAEIALDGANAKIDMKVSKDGLISAINMSPESIKIASSKIELDGQTIVSKLEGLYLDVSSIDAVEADFNSVWAVNGTFDNLTIGSYGISLASKYVCTGGKGVSAVGKTTLNYLDHDGNKKSTAIVINVEQYQLPTTNMHYLAYDGG